MPDPSPTRIAELAERTLRETFAANPDIARHSGAHQFDGVVGDAGPDFVRRRVAELDALAADLAAAQTAGGGTSPAERADLGAALGACRRERFQLADLRGPWHDPRQSLAVADVSAYVLRAYAPAAERAQGLCRHLEQLPEVLEAWAAMLDDELPSGPRRIAAEEARGHAAFYRDEVRTEIGDLDDVRLRSRLDAAVDRGARACDDYARSVERRRASDVDVLGAERFSAMLEAQEGIVETAPGLRARVDAEMTRLEQLAAEVGAQVTSGGPAAAFAAMEADHPAAGGLVETAQAMLDRLRDFWAADGAVRIDPAERCSVRPSPAFMSWVTAAYDNPGPLEPPGLQHHYYVTTVRPEWSADQAEQWLRHLNFASLENISVHEVYPGHFVHALCALAQPSLLRKSFWCSGFGEGWAHYTEQLAVEHGLSEGRPLLHLAMVQDALLRACRFSATVGMHTEGMTLEAATRLFEEHAHIPRLAAEREALRGTYDPMYLVYSYGKMEILRWREELSRRPGWSERAFHDRILGVGFAPLSVVRDQVLEPA